MTAKVLVRFTEDDLWKLQQEADRQGVSVPQLMRDFSLRALPSRRTPRSVPVDQGSGDEQSHHPAPASHVA
jgi:hypothetical protein